MERIELVRPVVPFDEDGARRLAGTYWASVRRVTRGLVRVRERPGGVDLVLMRIVPLLRFDPPGMLVAGERVAVTFPIVGGVLAAGGGGTLSIQQRTEPALELSIAVADYRPRLAGRSRRLYTRIQSPAHAAVSRRFLREIEASTGR